MMITQKIIAKITNNKQKQNNKQNNNQNKEEEILNNMNTGILNNMTPDNSIMEDDIPENINRASKMTASINWTAGEKLFRLNTKKNQILLKQF